MNREQLLSTLRAALASRDSTVIPAVAKASHPADVASVLAEFEPDEVRTLLRELPAPERAELFGYLEAETEVEVAHYFDRKELAELFLHMSPDDRADLFNRLTEERREMILPALAQAEREDIRRLALFPEGTAGAVMTSDYATVRPDFTAPEAVEHLRKVAPDTETIYQSYVVDENRRLIGTVSLRDLIVAPPHTRVSDFMQREPIFVRADAPREEAARLISRYDLIALPVVNGDEKLVGIVTYDDAMDVAEDEATTDFRKVGAVGELAIGLKEAPIDLLYRKRVFWLVALVFGNLFSGAGIAYFEETISAYVALVFFLPLLIGSGGNAGSQSATLMVRALATGDVVLKDWAGMLSRELTVAALLGATMALAVSTIGIVRGGPDIALVVALSMLVVVIVGSVLGMSLPFILSRLRLDPAASSAPLVATIADAAGVLIYFAIATAVLGLPALTN
jgi:magnesium transporter